MIIRKKGLLPSPRAMGADEVLDTSLLSLRICIKHSLREDMRACPNLMEQPPESRERTTSKLNNLKHDHCGFSAELGHSRSTFIASSWRLVLVAIDLVIDQPQGHQTSSQPTRLVQSILRIREGTLYHALTPHKCHDRKRSTFHRAIFDRGLSYT